MALHLEYLTVLPTVTMISPIVGTTAGGTKVSIQGAGLAYVTGVTIGGSTATLVSTDESEVIVTSPALTVGAKDVVVTNAAGSATLTAAFNVITLNLPTPIIHSVTPAYGAFTENTAITILGENLNTGGLVGVTLDGTTCTSIVDTATQITAITPDGTAAGVVVLEVENSVGTGTIDFTYTEPGPTVSTVLPVSGSTTGGTTITVNGAFLTGTTSVKLNDVACSSVTVISDAQLTCITPVGSRQGPVDLVVETPHGIYTKANAFTYTGTPVTLEKSYTFTDSMPAMTISYVTGAVTLDTDVDTAFEHKGNVVAGRLKPASSVTSRHKTTQTGTVDVTATATLSQVVFPLSWNQGEYVSGSLLATIDTRRYYDEGGIVYYDADPATGEGTAAGTIDTNTRTITLTDWPSVANSMTVNARTEYIGDTSASHVSFRTQAAPVAIGSFSLRANLYYNAALEIEATADNSGVITGSVANDLYTTTYCYGKIDYQTGVVDVYFGNWLPASGNTDKPWYDADAVRDGEVLYPHLIDLDSLRYDCVTYTILPLDSSMIGIDAVRLPADGRVPIYRDGQLVLVHHTDSFTELNLSPTQVLDCGRVRLYRAVIEDTNGLRLPVSFYALNRTAGTITMASDLNLTGYSGPYTIYHTIADLTAISNADLSGKLTITRALSHSYAADESRVSGVLYAGTLQARVTNIFTQATWTSVWSDSRIGDAPLAQYDTVNYPFVVTNEGAYPDRYLVRFTSTTAFQIYGEHFGLLATGNINETCEPTNSLTGNKLFSIDYRGWGGGWATGNCVRFNVVGACYPIDLIRATQPSAPFEADDSVELMMVGNVDN